MNMNSNCKITYKCGGESGCDFKEPKNKTSRCWFVTTQNNCLNLQAQKESLYGEWVKFT